MNFEIHYGYKHCSGDREYLLDEVHSRDEAEILIKALKNGECGKDLIKDDISCDCLVSSCPFKNQKAYFFYRENQKK